MLRIIKATAAALVLASGLIAGTAQALPAINGSVTVSDGLDAGFLPCAGGGIVGHCTALNPSGPGNTSGGTVDFLGTSGSGNAIVLAWDFTNPGATLNEICIPGFCFDITAVLGAPTAGSFGCANGSCADSETINISGVVTGAGFVPTTFTGSLALTGSCNGSGSACTGNFSGGYTYSLAATGRPFETPEPGTLALMGLALAGIGLSRRRSK